MTQAGDMGAVAAATALAPLVDLYHPNCVAMAGVCAGRPNKTNLGDVVAADRLFFHDTGKQTPTEVNQDLTTYNLRQDWKVELQHFNFREHFKKEDWWEQRPIPFEWQENWLLSQLKNGNEDPSSQPECNKFCSHWEQVIESLWQSGDLRDGQLLLTAKGRKRIQTILILHKGFPDLSPSGKTLPFNVHVGPMGSGNKVVEDERIWGFVSDHMRKTLGIEMEAAAIGEVVEAIRPPRPDALVMKGVMDFANHGRDDNFKSFAARAAAEALIAFLRDRGTLGSRTDAPSLSALEMKVEPPPNLSSEETVHPAILNPRSKVLPIPRFPTNRKHYDDRPQPSEAHHVAMAALLSNLAPGEDTFHKACAAAGLPHDLFWAASSPSDRWFSAIATALRIGALPFLMETAFQSLPEALRWRLKLTDSDMMLRVPRWDREDLYKYRLASGQRGGRGIHGESDLLGLSALRRIWGRTEPEQAALIDYFSDTEADTSKLADGLFLASSSQGEEGENQLGVAAEHLFAWCDAIGGENFLAWIVDHVNSLSPARFALITALMHWWDKGRKYLEIASQTIRDQPLDLAPRKSIDSALSRLSSLDRLLCDSGAAWWALSESPPSVQFAIRAARFPSVAALLETLGERRPSVFIQQILQLRHDRGAVLALARALRRLRIAGLDGDPIDPELQSALRCSLPEVTAHEIATLISEPRTRSWWLDLLSPPLTDVQISGLIDIYETSRHQRERDRARRWLCTTLDPPSVWDRLPVARRRQWIEELTDFELILVAPLLEVRPPKDASERNDWARLQLRVAIAREPAIHPEKE